MIDWNGFKGAAKRLEDIDIPRLASRIKVGEDEMHAFMDVETAGNSFDKQGRPKMLFEPHVFYRNLSGAKRTAAVKAGLAYKEWGEKPYPRDSYPRLLKAMQIDETAALKASSWGAGQVLGENAQSIGHPSVQDMVLKVMADEENHLADMISFIITKKIDDDLRRLAALKRPTTPDDCREIVKVYNGPKYERNKYHIKLAARHNFWRGIKDTAWQPEQADPKKSVDVVVDTKISMRETTKPAVSTQEDVVKHVQALLRDKGYPEVGNADGVFGKRTRNAILAFEADNDLPLSGKVSDDLLAQLIKAPMRQNSATRTGATADDLKQIGVPSVSIGDQLKKIGLGILAASGLGGVFDGTASFDQIKNGFSSLTALTEVVKTISPWLIGITIGGVVVLYGGRIITAQVEAYRSGNSV